MVQPRVRCIMLLRLLAQHLQQVLLVVTFLAFIMATGVTAQQTGFVGLAGGTSGSTYSAFTPNGTLDVYVVIITGSGVISPVTVAPSVTVTMN